MKMAERQNILAMGLDPAQVISFGGGWVNHSAPDEFRQAYESIVADAELFHKSGGYTATLGDMECREQIARFEEHLFGVPRLGAEHIAIGMGSTQLTHDLFRTLLDPGDTVMLLDPTYANYEGQLAFAVPGVKIVRLRVLDPQTWSYLPETDPAGIAREFSRLFDRASAAPGVVRRARQSDQPGLPQALADVMLAKTVGGRRVAGDRLRLQVPVLPDAARVLRVVARRSSERRRHPLELEVGARARPASRLDRSAPVRRRGDRARAAVQHPLPRHAVADDDGEVSEDGDRGRIAEEVRGAMPMRSTRTPRDVTLKAIDTHLQRPRLTPFGGLYTVVDIGTNADEFVPQGAQGHRRAGRARRRLRRVAHQRRAHLVRPARQGHREDRRRSRAPRPLDARHRLARTITH